MPKFRGVGGRRATLPDLRALRAAPAQRALSHPGHAQQAGRLAAVHAGQGFLFQRGVFGQVAPGDALALEEPRHRGVVELHGHAALQQARSRAQAASGEYRRIAGPICSSVTAPLERQVAHRGTAQGRSGGHRSRALRRCPRPACGCRCPCCNATRMVNCGGLASMAHSRPVRWHVDRHCAPRVRTVWPGARVFIARPRRPS